MICDNLEKYDVSEDVIFVRSMIYRIREGFKIKKIPRLTRGLRTKTCDYILPYIRIFKTILTTYNTI